MVNTFDFIHRPIEKRKLSKWHQIFRRSVKFHQSETDSATKFNHSLFEDFFRCFAYVSSTKANRLKQRLRVLVKVDPMKYKFAYDRQRAEWILGGKVDWSKMWVEFRSEKMVRNENWSKNEKWSKWFENWSKTLLKIGQKLLEMRFSLKLVKKRSNMKFLHFRNRKQLKIMKLEGFGRKKSLKKK